MLTARRNLALAHWSVNIEQGRPGHAALGFLAFALKALADSIAGVAGGRHLFVQRMARAAPPEEVDRWNRLWSAAQQWSPRPASAAE